MQESSFGIAVTIPSANSENVISLGHPRGFRQRSGTGQRLPSAPVDAAFRMRHDADVAPGQSGGPIHLSCGVAVALNSEMGCWVGGAGNIGLRLDSSTLKDALVPDIIDNGVLETEPDCNYNGINDWCDVGCHYQYGSCATPCGGFADCNKNLTPDGCEPATDWNSNSVQDICDIAAGTAPDCNFNFVIDGKDIADGFSEDANQNGIPDECAPTTDSNANGREDLCDIAIAENCDLDENGVPDDCQRCLPARCVL